MKIENPDLLSEYHDPGSCQMCGKACKEREPHHGVITRGAGGSDISINLIRIGHTQSWQCPCHSKVDSKEGRDECIRIIAKRERCTSQEIIDANNFIRYRLDKDWSEQRLRDSITQGLTGGVLTVVAARLVIRELIEAGKLPV